MSQAFKRLVRQATRDRRDGDYESSVSWSQKSRLHMTNADLEDVLFDLIAQRSLGGPSPSWSPRSSPGLELVAEFKDKEKPKPAPAPAAPKPEECKYKCCQCKTDKKKEEEEAKKCCHCVSQPAPAPAPAPTPCSAAAAAKLAGCCCHHQHEKKADEKTSEEKKPAEKKPDPPKEKEADCVRIFVRDRTDGPLVDLHGDRFEISISPKATADDIITMLAPDRQLHKVRVMWRDGEVEDLDDLVEFDDLKRFAKRLYIDKRVKVRFGR